MQYLTTLERENISDEIAAAVRTMILEGNLPEGERINEVRLAAELGVSRTPLREGLRQLTADGTLIAKPRRGYFVRPLSLEEFEQVYAIRPLLDPEALRLAGLPEPKEIERLAKLNTKLTDARDAATAIQIDDEWHLRLLAHCPNRVLLDLIEGIIRRTRRYELALMRETENVTRATEDHERILDALRQGDIEGACAALKANMESGFEPIAQWLKSRKEG